MEDQSEIIDNIKSLNTLEEELNRLRSTKRDEIIEPKFKDEEPKLKQPKSEEQIQQKTKKVAELKSDIQELEAAMQLEHRNLKGFKKKELEAYLAELMDKAGTNLSLGLDEPAEESGARRSENGRASNEGTQRPVFPDAEPPISQQLKEDIKKHLHATQVEAIQGSTHANALFHFNLIAMFLLERTTEQFEDQLHGSITGATRELREDYEKPDSPLRDLYMEIYAKYGKTIEPYMDPIARLTVYNLSIVQRSIKRKIEKKKDEQ